MLHTCLSSYATLSRLVCHSTAPTAPFLRCLAATSRSRGNPLRVATIRRTDAGGINVDSWRFTWRWSAESLRQYTLARVDGYLKYDPKSLRVLSGGQNSYWHQTIVVSAKLIVKTMVSKAITNHDFSSAIDVDAFEIFLWFYLVETPLKMTYDSWSICQ